MIEYITTMMKTITIEIPEGKKAEWVDGVLTLVDEQPVKFKFKIGDKVTGSRNGYNGQFEITQLVERNKEPWYRLKYIGLFKESDIEPYTEHKDITECIKTFDDACEWCKGNSNQGLYEQYVDAINVGLQRSPDILAYLKLRIITCALNEGHEIDIHQGDKIYSISCDQWDNELTVHENVRIMLIPKILIFKSKELALYAAAQFKDIYMDFCYKRKE